MTGDFAAFAGLLATRIYLCRPRDPEAKGLVEWTNGYLETSRDVERAQELFRASYAAA